MQLEDFNINLIKIDTGRLLLRPFNEKDLDDFFEYASVPGVGEAAGWNHHRTREESESVLKRFIEGRRTFAIQEKSSGKVIGSIGFEPSPDVFDGKGLGDNKNDVGYVLGSDYWNKGYAKEALRGIISYAFYVLHLDAVTCGHFSGNNQSRAVIEKCGFKFVCEADVPAAEGSKKALYYALTSQEFGVVYKDKDKK